MATKSDEKYRITIRNWDDYQREMRGGERRRRRRDWVAISTNLYRDPDFLNMTAESRLCWVMLLCHAGNVGPVFELCPSSARVLFQLRKSPDFQVLADQGFIDLEAATGQYRTVQDKTYNSNLDENDKTEPEKPPPEKPPKEPKPDPAEQQLEQLKSTYPKRAGSQPWKRAASAINARIRDGATWDEILAGVQRYRAYCEVTGKIRTEFVMMAATFLGRDEHFKEPWDPPQSSAESRSQRNVQAIHDALREDDE